MSDISMFKCAHSETNCYVHGWMTLNGQQHLPEWYFPNQGVTQIIGSRHNHLPFLPKITILHMENQMLLNNMCYNGHSGHSGWGFVHKLCHAGWEVGESVTVCDREGNVGQRVTSAKVWRHALMPVNMSTCMHICMYIFIYIQVHVGICWGCG